MAAAPAPAGASQTPPIPWQLFLIIGVLFYFMIFRPQQKQAKQQQAMVDALKKGDRILTQGGLYGVVAAVKGQVLEVKISDEVKVMMSRAAVSQVVSEDPAAQPEVPAAKA
jgi:preprotein translocase subunit YajC